MNTSTRRDPHWSVALIRTISSEATLADAAMRYANLGIPVFPCLPGGKQPLTRNGFHDATSSPHMVAHWWRRTPDANIGLPTGIASNVVVVDVDTHPAGSGFSDFERSRAAGLASDWAWLVRTPSGGLHAYYPATTPGQRPDQHDEQVERDPHVHLPREQRSWQAPTAHIDFRGDGGYVIAPPSRAAVHHASADGPTGEGAGPVAYTVIAVAHHRPHPIDASELRAFLDPPRPPAGPGPSSPPLGYNPARLAQRLADWVANRPEGARNQGLFWAACRMVERGHPYPETAATLGNAAAAAGLPTREIETTLRSAYRSTSAQPTSKQPTSPRSPSPRATARPTNTRPPSPSPSPSPSPRRTTTPSHPSSFHTAEVTQL